jgi:hypothetical protein
LIVHRSIRHTGRLRWFANIAPGRTTIGWASVEEAATFAGLMTKRERAKKSSSFLRVQIRANHRQQAENDGSFNLRRDRHFPHRSSTGPIKMCMAG